MDSAEYYNRTAEVYNLKHSGPTTEHVRGFEIRLIERFGKGRLLDAGCGTGYHFPVYERLGISYSGLDSSKEMAARAGPKASLGNIENLPYPDKSFDTVTCFLSVLSVCKNPEKAAKELTRILKPGGFLLLSLSSYWDLDWQPLEVRRKRKTEPGKTKIFKTMKDKLKIRLFTKQEILDLFPALILEYFDSCFSIAKPLWGDSAPFSKHQLKDLEKEKEVPKEYGAFYFFAFRKTSTAT